MFLAVRHLLIRITLLSEKNVENACFVLIFCRCLHHGMPSIWWVIRDNLLEVNWGLKRDSVLIKSVCFWNPNLLLIPISFFKNTVMCLVMKESQLLSNDLNEGNAYFLYHNCSFFFFYFQKKKWQLQNKLKKNVVICNT